MNYKQVEDYLDLMRSKRVLVIGDLIIDRYIKGTNAKISPEAPVPVINGNITTWDTLGGAGNVCKTIENFTVLRPAFPYMFIRTNRSGDSIKTRIVCNDHHVCRVDDEPWVKPLSNQEADYILFELEEYLNSGDPVNKNLYDAVILSDYAKSGLTQHFYSQLVKRVSTFNKNSMLIVDSKSCHMVQYDMEDYVDVVFTPNNSEFQQYMDKHHLGNVSCNTLVTNGDLGLEYIHSFKDAGFAAYPIVPFKQVHVKDACGAGDTVTALCALLLTPFEPVEERLEKLRFVQLVAEVSVQKFGVDPPTVEEVLNHAQELFGQT